MHCASGVLTHDCRLHRVPAVLADREHAVVGEQHCPRAVPGERVDDRPSDRLVTDDRERGDRDLAAELVRHAGDDAWDRFVTRSPRRRVGRVGVNDPADVRHVPVDVRVSGGVRRRCTLAARRAGDRPTVDVAQHHRTRGQFVVSDARRLDHEVVRSGHAGADVARCPDDEALPGQLGVERAHLVASSLDGSSKESSASLMRSPPVASA